MYRLMMSKEGLDVSEYGRNYSWYCERSAAGQFEPVEFQTVADALQKIEDFLNDDKGKANVILVDYKPYTIETDLV